MSRHAVPWSCSKISEQLLLDELAGVADRVGGVALDLGCGTKPYERLLGARVRRWIGLDFAATPSGPSKADVFASALEVPFKSCTFDVVLSTQMLEHVPRPEILFGEIRRILKPGGKLILTVPQITPLHEEPHDYYRFTCHGLRFLASQAGLEVVCVSPFGGAVATAGQMILWHSNFLRRFPLVGPTIADCFNLGRGWMVLKLDRVSRVYGDGAMKDTLGWLLVVRTPE